MRSNKIISIFIIIGLFAAFASFEIIRKSDKAVLNIITPTVIEIDLNGNKIFDNGETVCISDIETFTANLNVNQSSLAEKLKISEEDTLKLGYLTDSFADNILTDKRVKLKFTGKIIRIAGLRILYQTVNHTGENYKFRTGIL